MKTVAVVGGGASGMLAALAAAHVGAKVHLFERQARLGRKLAATGNGRCNLTNLQAGPHRYHGADPSFAACALERFTPERTLDAFRALGLLTTAEPGGRVYPLSDSAGSVVDVLRFGLDALGVEQHMGLEVQRIRRSGPGFRLSWDGGAMTAEAVIIACGGAAGGKLGASRSGYALLEAFGHSCTALHPALVQLRTEENWTRALKGVRALAEVRLERSGTEAARVTGEVQFTEYGLSGPLIFDLSRQALEGGKCRLLLDLLPGISREEVRSLLQQRIDTRPGLQLDDIFTGTVQNRIGRVLVKYAGLSGTLPLKECKAEMLDSLINAVKEMRFTVCGDLGFDNAQVTAGGIATRDFDAGTMESRLCRGLYACGEVLDVDGDCGGFNLQWAWSSGLLAGLAAGAKE